MTVFPADHNQTMPYKDPNERLAYSRKRYKEQRAKIQAYNKDWVQKHGGSSLRKDSYMRCVYGLSLEEYLDMSRRQEGKCAICHTTPKVAYGRLFPLYIDHDHATGKVRGLLCNRCNIGVSYVEDTPFVAEVFKYLNWPNRP